MENRQISKNSELKKHRRFILDRDKLLALFCSGRCGMLLTFLSGFLLTRVRLFEQYAPLGTAFSSASNKKYSFAATAGAVLGYLTVSGGVDGIKYIAATMLCFAAVHIFKDTGAFEYRIFIPLISAISMFGVGFVFLLEQGLSLRNILLFILEMSVTICAAWFYQDAQGFFSTGKPRADMPSYGTIVLLLSILCAFSGFKIAGFISPIRSMAALMVMYAASKLNAGASVGFVAGLLCDMLYGVFPFFCITYTAAGLCGGAIAVKRRRWAFTTMFVISGCVAALWCGQSQLTTAFAAELIPAGLIFSFLPEQFIFADRKEKNNANEAAKVREYISKKLSDTANAFSEIYDFMKTGISIKRQNDENMRIAFEYAAEKVCKKCEICRSCWEKEYSASFNAFNDAAAAVIKNGYAEASDYPQYFAARCLYFSEFREQVNRAAALMQHRRKYKAQTEHALKLVESQYSGAAQLFSELAEDVFSIPEFRPFDQKRVCSIMRAYDRDCRVSVFKNRQGGIIIETDSANHQKLRTNQAEICQKLCHALGRRFDGFSNETEQNSSKIIIRECENLSATIGVGVKKKHGQQTCGDSGAYFKTEDGTAYMLLSDGMGAGQEANAASSAALKLFESLLKSGITPYKAFCAAAPALKIRSQTDGFSTIDIFSVNLVDGKASLLKCGAAQSYLKIGGKVSKIAADGGLPAGLMPDDGMTPEIADIKMTDGDIAVIMSDGVADEGEDLWVAEEIRNYDAGSSTPKDLACRIISGAVKRGSDDDITVLVLRLDAAANKKTA